VPTISALASVEGVYNAVMTENDFAGVAMATGRGAGGGPTASAILSDLVDIARGASIPAFGLPAGELKRLAPARDENIFSEYYMHLVVYDRPGVIADVSAILRDGLISIESIIQRGRDPGQPVSVVLTTHACSRAAMRTAIGQIAELSSVTAPPSVLRIVSE
jgi:homoserine dehydrogenase